MDVLKGKGKQNCVIKQEIKFQDYKKSMKNNKTILKSQQRIRNELHNVFMKRVNQIALRENDDKRL